MSLLLKRLSNTQTRHAGLDPASSCKRPDSAMEASLRDRLSPESHSLLFMVAGLITKPITFSKLKAFGAGCKGACLTTAQWS